MKYTKFWVMCLLGFSMVGLSFPLSATSASEPPPRGRAYGYYLKDGGKVLFVYLEEDGSRLIELSQCHQNRRYLINRSEDLIHWTPLGEVLIGADGTAATRDTIKTSHCFYTVTRTK